MLRYRVVYISLTEKFVVIDFAGAYVAAFATKPDADEHAYLMEFA